MRFDVWLCPKCGAPAREVRARFVALVDLERKPGYLCGRDPQPDWSFGSVFRSRELKILDDGRATLVCGGGHEWQAKEVRDA